MTKLHLTNKHNKLYQDILVELKVFMYDLGIWSMKLPCPTIAIQVKNQRLKAKVMECRMK